MTTLNARIVALALMASLVPAAFAASSAASSASDSVTTSVGSISASFQRSSDSSTGNKVADGEYKVIEMAAVPDEAGKVRMKLQAMGTTTGDKEFVLLLPQEAVERGHVRVGGVVTARTRDYGYEFASLHDDKPFFLVLADEWFKELQSRPVAL